MPWFLNVSSTTKPIPVGNGNVVAVHPQAKVEVVGDLSEANRLAKMGVLRKCTPDAKKTFFKPVVFAKKEVKKSEFSTQIVEKGKTNSPKIPPVSVRVEEKVDAEQAGSNTMSAEAENKEKVKGKRSRTER